MSSRSVFPATLGGIYPALPPHVRSFLLIRGPTIEICKLATAASCATWFPPAQKIVCQKQFQEIESDWVSSAGSFACIRFGNCRRVVGWSGLTRCISKSFAIIWLGRLTWRRTLRSFTPRALSRGRKDFWNGQDLLVMTLVTSFYFPKSVWTRWLFFWPHCVLPQFNATVLAIPRQAVSRQWIMRLAATSWRARTPMRFIRKR